MDYRIALFRQHEETRRREPQVSQLQQQLATQGAVVQKEAEENTRLKRRVEFTESIIRHMTENLAPFKLKQDQMISEVRAIGNQVASLTGNQATIMDNMAQPPTRVLAEKGTQTDKIISIASTITRPSQDCQEEFIQSDREAPQNESEREQFYSSPKKELSSGSDERRVVLKRELVFSIAKASNDTNQTAAGTSTCGAGQKRTPKAAAEKSAKTITAFQRFQPY